MSLADPPAAKGGLSSVTMTVLPPHREIGRIRGLIRRGRARIAQIVAFNRRRRKRIAELEAVHVHKPVVMFDSVTVSEIPRHAQAVAGYVGGAWPTYEQLVRDFPHAWKVPIAVNSGEGGTILDVEPGDATNATAVGWYRRRRSEGAKVLGFYTAVSNAEALIATLEAAGVKRGAYLLWTAHWTFHPHICSPHSCGYPGLRHAADATQWTDQALGRNLDQSLCHPRFFTG